MIVMSYTGCNGEGAKIQCHKLLSYSSIENLACDEDMRSKYEEMLNPSTRYSRCNPKFYSLVKIPDEQVKDAMNKGLYESMTNEEKRKWLLSELLKLESK